MLLVIALFWGGAFFFVSIAIKDLPPMTLGAARILIGGAILLAILYGSGRRLPWNRQAWLWFTIVAAVNSVAPLFLLSWAQKTISGGVTSIITALTPLLVLFLAHFLTSDEKLDSRRLAGTAVGFAGVAVMIGLDARTRFDLAIWAQLAAVLASVFFALGTVFARRFRTLGIEPLTATTGFILMSGIIFLVLSLAIDRPWTLPVLGAAAIWSAVGAGALSTALGQFLFFRLIAQTGANNISLVAVLTPISAILLGSLILGETLHVHHLIGMATVAIGLAIVDGRPIARLKSMLWNRTT